MGLRIKILSGFLVLSLLLLIAGLWSIYELNSISSSFKNSLDENYQSIRVAKRMKEALEREDSGILLLLLGKWEGGRSILHSADSLFEQELEFAYTNITIPGEKKHLESIKSKYSYYKSLWERPIVDTGKERNMEWYFQKMHSSFLAVKEPINDLITINNKMMYETAAELQNRSNRTILPGIVAVLSALVFTFIFNYLVNYYLVSPLIRITDQIRKFREKRIPFNVTIETKDEIFYLADTIQNLCQSLSAKDNQ